MPDAADPLPSQPPPGPCAAARPDPDMPPRKAPSGGKLKKPLTEKLRAAAEQRLAHLRSSLVLRPLGSPAREIPPPHEAALRALGLLDFARIDLSDTPRPDLVAPLVAYYDPGCRRSFVRGVRVSVSRADLARALSLPPKPAPAAAAPRDVDPAAAAPAVMQLLQEHVMLPFLGDDMCILPQEVAAAEQAVREGAAHRVDWAGLIWGLVEKEMLELPKRDDGVCYYGPHLQRLIWAQRPNLFVPVEEGDREDTVPEASVDVEMDGDDIDADADVKSKSLEELELGHEDENVVSKSLEESELGNADTKSNNLYGPELGDGDKRINNMEMGLGDVGTSQDIEESEAVDEAVRSKILSESEADKELKCKSLDELQVVESVKCTGLDESETVDECAKGTDLDELDSGFVSVDALPPVHDVVPAEHGKRPAEDPDTSEVATDRVDDMAVASEEEGVGPSLETVVVTQEEVVAIPEEVGNEEEEEEEEEEKDATGLSLGINSTNDYDSMDVEEETNVENLDEGDSDNENSEDSEDDAYDCQDDINWRTGNGKGAEGMTHCLERCNTFGGMEFENLNKGEAEMRDELRFDDFSGRGSFERMNSSNLLQAMSSMPSVPYNVTENMHDLSSGEFLAMGVDTHKNGVDLGPGSSYLFGNNGKRHMSDIDSYNENMQVEQFPQCNQQKRMRHSNNSSMLPGSAVFDANFSVPLQNLMAEASRLYAQKEQEIQNFQFEKQQWADMMQQKDAMIQAINSSKVEQQKKHQAELRRFEHDLNIMAQLVTAYKKALKQTQASFKEYRKNFPCNKPLYADVTDGGGLVVSVKELQRRQLEDERQKLAAANEMIENFQYEWFSKFEPWDYALDRLQSRMEELSKKIQLLKENRKAECATLTTEQ